MAERRMLTKKVTDDDNFISLSSSAQALYLHLSINSDDDGFCNQISTAMFKAHASVQDLQALLERRYIYQFESGVIVIKHWRMANALRKDRYTPTAFQEELAMLNIKENGAYTLADPGTGCQVVAERLPDGCQVVATGKDSIGETRLEEDRVGDIRYIVEFLNSTLGTNYKPTTDKTKRLIRARLNEGFSVEDFETVITKMAAEWKDDAKMAKYLRPVTLFGTNFESYLNQPVKQSGWEAFANA